MDGRNDKDNNRYGLRNREHSNCDDVMSINKQRSNDEEKEEDEEDEEDEVDRPHQRCRVDKTNNEDPEEMLDVPRVIDFEDDLDQILNPEGREGGHEENNVQRGTLRDNQGQGGGGHRRTANNQGQGGGGRGGGDRGGGGRGGGGCGGTPQIHAGGRGPSSTEAPC